MINSDKIYCHITFSGNKFICWNAEGVHASLLECWRGTW